MYTLHQLGAAQFSWQIAVSLRENRLVLVYFPLFSESWISDNGLEDGFGYRFQRASWLGSG
jgi:hypothetical protein